MEEGKTVQIIESDQSKVTIVANNQGNVIGTLIISKGNPGEKDGKVEKIASQAPLRPCPKP